MLYSYIVYITARGCIQMILTAKGWDFLEFGSFGFDWERTGRFAPGQTGAPTVLAAGAALVPKGVAWTRTGHWPIFFITCGQRGCKNKQRYGSWKVWKPCGTQRDACAAFRKKGSATTSFTCSFPGAHVRSEG